MRNSRRIKRMSRNRVKIGKMNLTSLMDVFTILVFFLLVNSGSVELVEAPKDVSLPESLEESKPRETVVVAVSPEDRARCRARLSQWSKTSCLRRGERGNGLAGRKAR